MHIARSHNSKCFDIVTHGFRLFDNTCCSTFTDAIGYNQGRKNSFDDFHLHIHDE